MAGQHLTIADLASRLAPQREKPASKKRKTRREVLYGRKGSKDG
jgi:hypothetical protein